MTRRKSFILVVDDEPDILEILAEMLRDHEVATALRAEQAIEVLKERACDLLITDIKMPGQSGLELIEWVGRNRPGTPVVVLTGHGSIENMPANVSRWMQKPFRGPQIRDVVEELLGDQE